MNVIAFIIIGLLAGLIARALVPGRQPMGIVATTLLGIVGSLVGGFVGTVIWHRNQGEFSPGGLILSVAGAVVALLILGAIRGRRPLRA
jgi:uncharacterized membrane protein YeaQ/YmgE (transglycosylase-associated protein family)